METKVDESTRELWDDLRLWFPPFDSKGRWFKTKYLKTESKNGVESIIMECIPIEDVLTGKCSTEKSG